MISFPSSWIKNEWDFSWLASVIWVLTRLEGRKIHLNHPQRFSSIGQSCTVWNNFRTEGQLNNLSESNTSSMVKKTSLGLQTLPLAAYISPVPLPSNRQHLSYSDCLEGKRGDYLTSSVLLCIIIVHTYIMSSSYTVDWIGLWSC